MKKTGVKQQQKSGLKRRLELVRSTIRELTPTQLGYINGGTETTQDPTGGEEEPFCPPFYSGSD